MSDNFLQTLLADYALRFFNILDWHERERAVHLGVLALDASRMNAKHASYLDDAMREDTAAVAAILGRRIHSVLFNGRRYVSAHHFLSAVLAELRKRDNVVGIR